MPTEVKTITKQLGGAQDLLLGNSQEVEHQIRRGKSTSITKIDIPLIIDTIEGFDLSTVDTDKHRTIEFLGYKEKGTGGGLFQYDDTDITTAASPGEVLVSGTKRFKRLHKAVSYVADRAGLKNLVGSTGQEVIQQDINLNYTWSNDIVVDNGGTKISVGSGGWISKTKRPTFEHFGAIGDGITDDTEAVQNAISSHNEVYATSKEYLISEGITGSQDIAIIGTLVEESVFKRSATSTSTYVFRFTSQHIKLVNIVVDGNRDNNSNKCHSAIITSSALDVNIDGCIFTGGKAVSGYGGGLSINMTNEAVKANITNSIFRENDADGCSSEELHNFKLSRCTYINNGGTGLYLNNFDETFQQKIEIGTISDCIFRSNGDSGLVVGNFIANNDFNNPVFGSDNLEATNVTITNCVSDYNGKYGIILECNGGTISGCTVKRNGSVGYGGVLCNSGESVIDGNVVSYNGFYGIDSGGSSNIIISNNKVNYNGSASGVSGIGIAIGGSINALVTGNLLRDNGIADSGVAITIHKYEGNGGGYAFPQQAKNISILSNLIDISDTRTGVKLYDGCSGVTVKDNTFDVDNYYSPDNLTRCIVAVSNVNVIKDNTLYGYDTPLDAVVAGELVKPEVLDSLYINTTDDITNLTTGTIKSVGDGVAWITMDNEGSGYGPDTTAVVTATSGSGATAKPIVHDGAIKSIAIIVHGEGYSDDAVVSITGTGTGASGTVQVGLPLTADIEVLIQSNDTCVLKKDGVIQVRNLLDSDIKLHAGGACKLRSRFGRWEILNESTTISDTELSGIIEKVGNNLLDLPLRNSLRTKVGSQTEATYSCATNHSFINMYERLETVSVDVPAFGETGILVPQNATNLITRSNELTHADWTKTRATIEDSTDDSIESSVTSFVFRETTDDGEHHVQQTISVLTGETYTMSAYFHKDQVSSDRQLVLRLAGVIVNSAEYSPAIDDLVDDGTLVKYDNGFRRIIISGTAGSDGTLYLRLQSYTDGGASSFIGEADKGFDIDHVQLVKKNIPSDYIETSDTSATRGAGNLSIEKKNNFRGWAYPFSISMEFVPTLGSGVNNFLFYTGTLANGSINLNSSDYLVFKVLGGSAISVLLTQKTKHKITCTSDGTAIKLYIDGALKGTSSVGGNTEVDDSTLYIGDYGSGELDSELAYFKVKDYEMSQNEITLTQGN